AFAQLVAVGLLSKAEYRKRPAFRLAEARRFRRVANMSEPSRDRIERIDKVAPFGRRVGAVRGKPAARPLPSGERRLGMTDLVRAHALKEIVPGVVLAHMGEAEKPPGAGAIEI